MPKDNKFLGVDKNVGNHVKVLSKQSSIPGVNFLCYQGHKMEMSGGKISRMKYEHLKPQFSR